MKKVITILVLVVILGSTLISCKKDKKLVVTPQNKFLFTAKKKGYTSFVKLNTKTITKLIIASIPLPPDPKEFLYAKQDKSDEFQKKSVISSRCWKLYNTISE